MSETEQAVNSISPSKIKVEPLSDTESEVSCRLCVKTFAHSTALLNHAKISHIEAYATGDPTMWTLDEPEQETVSPKQRVKPKAEKKDDKINLEILQRTHEIVSSMKPVSLTSLASSNVSYIIIKSDDQPKERRQRKPKEAKKVDAEPKTPEAITGPFECLESSSFGTDGVCHQMFFSCCEYSEHQLVEHTRPRRRAARCVVCERPLLQSHTPKPFPCEHCMEGFDNAQDLAQHKLTDHARKKKFECSLCHKRFSAQGGLIQHMRMHTGDRPYHCPHCPKAFTQKSGLEQHIRTHTKEKPFRCVVCNKSFVQTVHLRQHMRTHTNVMPFQCVVCEKRFKQSSHLNYHLKHHPNTMTNEQREKYLQIIGNITRRAENSEHNIQGNQEPSEVTQESLEVTQESLEVTQESVEVTQDLEVREDGQYTYEEGMVDADGIQEEGTYAVEETYTFVEGMDRVITFEVPRLEGN